MSFYIEKIILHNRAPFKHLELDFKEKGITLLTAVNGGGKTTILSHIVDAWYEMACKTYSYEFEGKEGKYYRVGSPTYALDNNVPSIVYIRFKNDDKTIDYIDIRGECDTTQYDDAIGLNGKIPFSNFSGRLESNGTVKYVNNADEEEIIKIFSNNLVTSFPAYRYEQPGYLNDPYQIDLKFNFQASFKGYLSNPLEVVSGLPELANWILDLMLDHQFSNSAVDVVLHNINQVFSNTISTKVGKKVGLCIGPRSFNSMRIRIIEVDDPNSPTVYPTIFDMSSGENALICLFGELVRQYDRIRSNQPVSNATGIILIDEVDKHLHIKYQKEILPKLISMFPNVQFIVSSHSPFVTMGLAEVLPDQSEIIDLDRDGLPIQPEENSQYQEVYEMMIEENERFYNQYQKLIDLKEATDKLIIISEGDNIGHIKKALEIKAPQLLNNIEFLDGVENITGKDQLIMLYRLEIVRNKTDRVLFVWDCDVKTQVDGAPSETEHTYKFCLPKNNNNNKVKKGIENLYPEAIFTDEFYVERENTDGYGCKICKQEFSKNNFLNHIKESQDVNLFDNFQPLIDKIDKILGR